MSQCNYCSVKRMRADADRRMQAITLVNEDGWQRAYQHPKGMDFHAVSKTERAEYMTGSLYLEVGCGCSC